MRKNAHLAFVGLSVILLMSMVSHANAWEFGLKGSFNWTHEWYDQMGEKGFFGRYNVDNGVGTRAQNLNFWNGGQFDTNFVTGSSSGWSYFNVEFEPEIKINPAIRMRGFYRLGTWGDPAASDYHTQDAPGTKSGFSQGQWTQFWLTANTPWGVFGVGKRPWSFGTGLQYDGADAATTESIVLVAPYGPFDFGMGFYPYRFVGTSSILVSHLIRNRVAAEAAFGDPYDLPRYYETETDLTTPGQYFSRADRSGSFSKDFLVFVSYSSGPLQFGALGAFGGYHIGPEALLLAHDEPSPLIRLDAQLAHGTIFLKYNNGRVFLNTEAAWLYWTDRYQPRDGFPGQRLYQDSDSVYMPYTRYIEQWRGMLEAGAFAGPAKVSVITAWSPGPDRRGGRYIDRQSAAFVWHPKYDAHLGNFSVFRTYSYLFSYDYGSGLNAYNLTGDGFLRDAFVLAGRVDYAVASNLNVFGTFFWAQRTSHGYPWGVLYPHWGDDGDGNVHFNYVSPGPLNIPINRLDVPNIPDGDLGYEINVGFDWQLLEGWQAGVVFGYWAPGKWFKYACVDRSVSGWNNPPGQYNWNGANPDRTIDPIIGGEFSMKFEF
ncbi:MAG: hypothetical protein ACP5M0_02205 [Desulfomonilaceae bacterium]